MSVARKTAREQTTTGEHRRVQEPLSNGKSQNETNTSFQRSTTKRLRLGVKPTKLNLRKVSDTRMYWHTPGQGPIFSVACLFIKQMVQGTNRLLDNNKKERKKWTVNMIPLFCVLDFLAEVAAVVPKVIMVINEG